MWQRALVVLSLAVFVVCSPVHRPVKRDTQSVHIVEVPPPHLEQQSHLGHSQSHLDQPSQTHHLDKSQHHFDQPSSQSHHLDGSQSHLVHPSSQSHHLDGSQSHLVHPSQSHHLDRSQHHLEQPSQNHHLGKSHHFDQPSHHLDLDHPRGHDFNLYHHENQPSSQQKPSLDRSQSQDHNEVPQSKPKGRKGPKKGRKSNEDLLHHVGMTKLRSPSVNYHRKRLASQSRKTHGQKSSSDSKMFVIKLPPNPYYYAHHNLKGYDVMEPQPNSVNKVPVNFNTNGKPSRVYHWNIPMLKKMVARKAGSAGKSAILADSDIFNIDKQATWNETDDDKSYRKAVFYGPKKQSKHTFRKYFAGNGKPHSFYVMDKKNKSPSNIYRLMP